MREDLFLTPFFPIFTHKLKKLIYLSSRFLGLYFDFSAILLQNLSLENEDQRFRQPKTKVFAWDGGFGFVPSF